MKRMLITGATGSLGTELVGQYCRTYEIYAHGRDADRLLKLRLKYPGIQLVLGDLRCHGLEEAIAGCNVVIHAAAQKYVDLAEKHCYYTVDTNVVCTQELAELAALVFDLVGTMAEWVPEDRLEELRTRAQALRDALR